MRAQDGKQRMTDVAREGGEIAGNARKEIEANMGRPVVTSKNAAALNAVVANLIEDVADKTEAEGK